MNGLFRDFKINFKGGLYSRPFWISETNPTYAPQIIYEDINKDQKKELIIILTKGYGTGVLWELTEREAEIIVGDKECKVDISTLKIKPENLFADIGFRSIIDYEISDNQLIVSVAGQISPASFVGNIVIVYEYKDKMYQAKSIEFQPFN